MYALTANIEAYSDRNYTDILPWQIDFSRVDIRELVLPHRRSAWFEVEIEIDRFEAMNKSEIAILANIYCRLKNDQTCMIWVKITDTEGKVIYDENSGNHDFRIIKDIPGKYLFELINEISMEKHILIAVENQADKITQKDPISNMIEKSDIQQKLLALKRIESQMAVDLNNYRKWSIA